MKHIIFIFLIVFLFSCNSNHKKNKVKKIEYNQIKVDNADKTQNQSKIESIEDTDIFCDTTKFPDFKKNLEQISYDLENTKYHNKKAKEFIDESCAEDSLFCGEIIKKQAKLYKFNSEWSLNLVGYVLGKESGMEKNSANFFVLTINRNGQIWFTDILYDLMGEIQVTLDGFEYKDRQVIVWGHVYPYFEPDYGKFKLTIENGTGLYEYECHTEN